MENTLAAERAKIKHPVRGLFTSSSPPQLQFAPAKSVMNISQNLQVLPLRTLRRIAAVLE
jgi:hypothetical protein